MGVPILVLGASGSGKSASLRNFSEKEIGIFNVASKPLPFRKRLPVFNHVDYQQIEAALRKNTLKCYCIDDSQYLMAFYMFSRAKEPGYTKFTNCAVDFYKLLTTIREETTPDTLVFMLHHTERSDDGHIKAKTQGKMLDSQLTLEGLFSIVLMAETDGKSYWFTTRSDGFNPVKTPMGMFADARIDNDLKMVDTTVRDYYDFITKETKK